MLKQRVLTALVLIPLIVLAVLKLPTDYFAILLIFIISLGAWEWSALAGLEKQVYRYGLCLCFILSAVSIYVFFSYDWIQGVILIAIAFWISAFAMVMASQRGKFQLTKNLLIRSLFGWMVLVPACLSMLMLHADPDFGRIFILYLFILIWLADSVAYFAGRKFGKHKLADKVSPGKSWEGAIAAVLATLLLAIGFAWYFQMTAIALVSFIVLSAVTVSCSILGDLFESLVKRTASMKDSGNLLPGHGGILDRIDSLTVAAPVFLIGFKWLGEIAA